MLVLEATDELQGDRNTDYHWATTGELVHLPVIHCEKPGCGCCRGFCGFDSHRATTTAKVVERPDYDVARLARELSGSLRDGGWIATADPTDELVVALTDEIVDTAHRFITAREPNRVLEVDGDWLSVRHDASLQLLIDHMRRSDDSLGLPMDDWLHGG